MARRTNSRLKQAAEKAVSSARRSASRARAALQEEKARKMIDAVEVGVGGVAAGVAHGAGIDLEMDGARYPAGLPAGAAAVALGVAMDQRDLACIGLGSLTYGAGRVAEDMTRDAMAA